MEKCESTLRILKTFQPFRKIAKTKLRAFSIEITLVALGIRTGYLFDLFSLHSCVEEPALSFLQLIRELSKAVLEYQDIIVIQTIGGDLFIVNKKLFLTRCHNEFNLKSGADSVRESTLAPNPWVNFVSLNSSSPVLVHSLPSQLHEALNEIYFTIKEQEQSEAFIVTLPSHITAPYVIPIAAVLLEYPVAYTPDPSMDQVPFLAGMELEVFSCSLASKGIVGRDSDQVFRHTFMQFSCPTGLGRHLDSESIYSRLKDRMGKRIMKLLPELTLEISGRIERLDRVAL